MSETLDDVRVRGYAFDNAGEETRRRFVALAALYDPSTKRHLRERGIGRGWKCLEVGARNSSIAVWLTQQVTPSDSVLATDIDTRFLAPHGQITKYDGSQIVNSGTTLGGTGFRPVFTKPGSYYYGCLHHDNAGHGRRHHRQAIVVSREIGR